MFETTHMLGTLLASSPLLVEAWRQCTVANAAKGATFAVEQVGDVYYVAFSGVQVVPAEAAEDPTAGEFFREVPIGLDNGVFSPLVGVKDEEEEEENLRPVLVHAVALRLFLFSVYNTPEFQKLLAESKGKSLVFTGHSLGGAIASLATLCLLCSSQYSAPSVSSAQKSLLCITFGSPLLGNESLSRAILRERWGGNFFHVVSRHDILPRLLFCPVNSIDLQLVAHLLQSWQFSIRFPQYVNTVTQLSDEQKIQLQLLISMHVEAAATERRIPGSGQYWPFGSYLFCSSEGAVCVDNPMVIAKMLYLTFVSSAVDYRFEEEHISYGDLVVRIYQRSLLKGSMLEEELPRSSYDVGISLALEALGIDEQDMGAREAQECVKMANTIGRVPSLNCAALARELARVTPFRAEMEWYKASCDDNGMGYYDTFKTNKASKREIKVNLNRLKLASFWDRVLDKLQHNVLPLDFDKRGKWVNASQFYKLLVEPLDIAEYYRANKQHKEKRGKQYLTHGRERRYEVFDRWWRDMYKDQPVGGKRSKFAGLTQDSCFWARVEEARDFAGRARKETDPETRARLFKSMDEFDRYSQQLVERKEVSVDVLAERSSYMMWMQEWKQLKSDMGL